MSQLVSSVKIAATKKPAKAAVIFVHGLGDSGSGWSWFPQLVKQAGIVKGHESINFVFPNAPQMPITANGGYVMPGWFDIYAFGNPDAKQDEDGFFKSCDVLKALVHEQIEQHNVPPERIVIGGFLQGAALSLATACLLDVKIGGVVALSGFCPVRQALTKKLTGEVANVHTPIFHGHGTADPIINFEFGKLTKEFYSSLGLTKYQFHSYPDVPHSASEEELADVMKFIDLALNF